MYEWAVGFTFIYGTFLPTYEPHQANCPYPLQGVACTFLMCG